MVWNQRFSTVNKVVTTAKQYLTQWKATQERSFTASPQPKVDGDGVISWVMPQQYAVKITVDVAIFDDREEVLVLVWWREIRRGTLSRLEQWCISILFPQRQQKSWQ